MVNEGIIKYDFPKSKIYPYLVCSLTLKAQPCVYNVVSRSTVDMLVYEVTLKLSGNF